MRRRKAKVKRKIVSRANVYLDLPLAAVDLTIAVG